MLVDFQSVRLNITQNCDNFLRWSNYTVRMSTENDHHQGTCTQYLKIFMKWAQILLKCNSVQNCGTNRKLIIYFEHCLLLLFCDLSFYFFGHYMFQSIRPFSDDIYNYDKSFNLQRILCFLFLLLLFFAWCAIVSYSPLIELSFKIILNFEVQNLRF
jgi:hypothetical protein